MIGDDQTDPRNGASSDIEEEASSSETEPNTTPTPTDTETEQGRESDEEASVEGASQTEETPNGDDDQNEQPTTTDDAEENVEEKAGTESNAPAGEAREEVPVDDTQSTMDSRAEQESGAETAEEPGVPQEVLRSRMESVLFASPEPMSVRKLANILGIDGKEVRSLATELVTFYQDRGIILEEISKGFQFRTHPKNAAVIRDVFKLKPLKISKAALETLAIVAYRQPLTRAEAEQIRGVDCGGVLKYLFEKELVRVIGRKEEPGRPIIYGTTNAFLELFGLKSLSDLPALHEFSELWEENQRIVDEEMPNLEESDARAKPTPRPRPEKNDPTPPPADTSETISRPQNQEEEKSGVENQEEIGDESIEPTKNEGDDHMGDNKDQKPAKGNPDDPAQVPTEVIDESEMEEILASIEAPSPIPDGEESEDAEDEDGESSEEEDAEKVGEDD